jgi:dTDP-4-dehydrorhamnose 3,5-epimerase
MIFRETELPGAYVIEPEAIEDFRGFFARAWCRREFEAHGLNPDLAQVNLAFSRKKNTLRGMHYQVDPFAEAKSVRCLRGAIYDVVIDLRPDSPTFRRWTAVELTAENRRMFYIPEGFAHGYQTLTDDAEVLYQVSQFYAPECERGIRWNDPAFAVKWPEADRRIISEKDAGWPLYPG